MKLITIDGCIVASYTTYSNRLTLDLNLLPRGLYILSVATGSRHTSGKVELR